MHFWVSAFLVSTGKWICHDLRQGSTPADHRDVIFLKHERWRQEGSLLVAAALLEAQLA
jgi:hypothetical protein